MEDPFEGDSSDVGKSEMHAPVHTPTHRVCSKRQYLLPIHLKVLKLSLDLFFFEEIIP